MKTLFFLALAITVSCMAASPDRSSQIDDIREAAFRYQFEKNGSSLQQKADVYFLSILSVRNSKEAKGDDPSDAFMKRFAGHKPRVAKGSESRTFRDGVRDKKTSEKGLIFNLGEVRWISDDTVEIDGGHYEAGLSASGNTFFLKKNSGKWVVEKSRLHWIFDATKPPNQSLQPTGLLARG